MASEGRFEGITILCGNSNFFDLDFEDIETFRQAFDADPETTLVDTGGGDSRMVSKRGSYFGTKRHVDINFELRGRGGIIVACSSYLGSP